MTTSPSEVTIVDYDNALLHLMDAVSLMIDRTCGHASTIDIAFKLAEAIGQAQKFRRLAGAPDCGPELVITLENENGQVNR